MADSRTVRRLSGSRAGGFVLDALAAAGGDDAWSRGAALATDIEEIYFDDRGAIRESRKTRLLMTRTGPPRLVLTSADGLWKIGIGASGPWASGKGSNGLWSPEVGPGTLPADARNRLALRTAWLHRLPYNLGDVDVTLEMPAARGALEAVAPVELSGGESVEARGGGPADSLLWLAALRPAAPGDTATRRVVLGFDPTTQFLAEARFESESPVTIVHLGDYRADAADTPIRPHRLTYFEIDAETAMTHRVLEARLGPIDWHPAVSPAEFEPPAE